MTGIVIITRIINAITGIIAFILGLYVLLQILGASSGAPIIAWFYSIGASLSAPFRGIFPNLTLGGSSVVDVSAVIAALVYALIGYLLVAFITGVFARTTTTHAHTTHHVEE